MRLPVAFASESKASDSGVPAASSVPSARLQRATASERSNAPTSGSFKVARSAASRAAGERFNTRADATLATTQAIANGTLQRATPSDRASTKRVGAGSAAPKPSKIVLKVGTTPTSKPAVISSDSSSTITG